MTMTMLDPDTRIPDQVILIQPVLIHLTGVGGGLGLGGGGLFPSQNINLE